MIKRRVKLKITSSSRQTIKFVGKGLTSTRCPACGCHLEAVTEDEAQRILRANVISLDHLVAGHFHSIQTIGGKHICKDSLLSKQEEKQR